MVGIGGPNYDTANVPAMQNYRLMLQFLSATVRQLSPAEFSSSSDDVLQAGAG